MGEDDDRLGRDLSRWFDGALEGRERLRVEEAIRKRPELAGSLEFYEAVRATIRARRGIRPGAGLTDRILRAVFPGGACEPVWVLVEPLVKRLALAASILLVATLGLWVLVPGSAGERLSARGPIRTSSVERVLLGERGGDPGTPLPFGDPGPIGPRHP